MSTPVSPQSRFYRVAADAVGTVLGLLVLYLGVHTGTTDESAVGLGLVAIGASQLHTDLTA